MKLFHTAWKCALLLVVVAATGCFSRHTAPDAAVLPPMELRAIQTRNYDQPDPKVVLKTVLDVLQDEGFIVDYGHTELGILHATKTITVTEDLAFNRTGDFFGGISGSRLSPTGVYDGVADIGATVNVTRFASGTKVRVSLQRINTVVRFYSYNGPIYEKQGGPIVDAKIYQEFFAKLDRGMFLQKQGL